MPARRLVLRQAGVDELLGERLHVFQLQPVGTVADLVFLLGVLQSALAVEELEQEMLVVLEAVIAKADGILDDVIGAALVLLRLDAEVAAQADLHLFASFQIVGGGLVVHST